jgi:hypothetical protein
MQLIGVAAVRDGAVVLLDWRPAATGGGGGLVGGGGGLVYGGGGLMYGGGACYSVLPRCIQRAGRTLAQ